MANKKVYRHGGAKYNFEEAEDGKLVLVSISIFGKNFVFPNGGIPEQDIEQIVDNVKEEVKETNEDGEINRLNEIAAFLRGYPEGTTLEEVLRNIESGSVEHITDEEIADWYNNNG